MSLMLDALRHEWKAGIAFAIFLVAICFLATAGQP
jgi:hypothetical protein